MLCYKKNVVTLRYFWLQEAKLQNYTKKIFIFMYVCMRICVYVYVYIYNHAFCIYNAIMIVLISFGLQATYN